ncbi:hypothetical protein [Lysinibacillus sp. OTC-L20]|uniref:hypothetical protein n=1 Tax=Lysinibacillus sp. OTC-L20 TaxID=3342791 RepID=UPI0035BAF65B
MAIEIRQASIEDRSRILVFLKEHWNSEHIFVRNPQLFDYYHLKENKITFVIAEENETRKILGIQGYILANNNENPDVWGVIWKVIPNSVPMLGVLIMKYIRKTTNCRIFAGVGANPNTTLKIIKGMREFTGKLDHYYRLADLERYSIAKVEAKIIPPINICNQRDLLPIKNEKELLLNFNMDFSYKKPFKSMEYIIDRYFNHPIHKYKVYAIIQKDQEKYISIIVCRIQEYKESKVLRIIDFIGNVQELKYVGIALQKMLDSKEYEYIDFYCKGIEPKILQDMGFILRDENDKNIIPNYFEPFIAENIEIYYNTSDDVDFYVFKGDGDQDRPNTIHKEQEE